MGDGLEALQNAVLFLSLEVVGRRSDRHVCDTETGFT